MNELTQETFLRTVTEFRNLTVKLQKYDEILSADISECDRAFGDIRHYCEFNDIDVLRAGLIYERLRSYGIRHRKCKDMRCLIEPLVEFIKTDKAFINNIGRITNEMNKQYKNNNSDRVYTPRVLDIQKIITGEADIIYE